jgi:DNA-binding transcriptional ArsR family regulator
MKRDFDLIREILLDVEKNAKYNEMYFPKIIGYTDDEINYNIKLLLDAGLVEMYKEPKTVFYHNFIRSITYKGHEFLDSIRVDNIWVKTRKTALEKTGTLTFEIIKTVSSQIIKSLIS